MIAVHGNMVNAYRRFHVIQCILFGLRIFYGEREAI